MCRENPRRSEILLEEICQEDQRVCPLYGHFAPPGGVLRIQATGMIEGGQKSKPQKISRASNKTQNPWIKS